MKLVGRYQLKSRIGQGAMANVFRAHDPEIQRDLAIKILNQQYRRDPECVSRFLREARAAGSLSHPNIVTIYDVGEAEGFPYIAMELLNGEPLDKAMETKGAFPIAQSLAISAQLADALRYAHARGIVHRDIKPSNVFLAADGSSAKLLDFGIARVSETPQSGLAEATLKTQLGQVLGTPRYMSPEQAMGQPLDGRSDLFSLGVVIYEMICGKPAFNGASIATLAVQIATQDPEPIAVMPECPRGLKFIVDKLLAKKPERRFENGDQLLSALKREMSALTAATADDRGRSLPLHLRFTMIAAGVAAAVLTAGISLAVGQQYQAMERVAVSSGTSIANFVAANTALHVVDNAARPEGEADWAPVQAFLNTASADPSLAGMMVIDKAGIIRASADASKIGKPYIAPSGARPTDANSQVLLARAKAVDGPEVFRFTRPITYAGHNVGSVEVSLRKDGLEAAAAFARWLLVGLGALTMAVVLGLSFLAGRLVLSPVRRLNAAMKDAAAGNLDFRISHSRRDEFGELFDNFNALAASLDAGKGIRAEVQVDLAATMLRSASDALENAVGPASFSDVKRA